MNAIASAAVAAGVFAACLAPVASAQGRPPAAVRVAPVQQQELQEHRRVTGELRAISRSRVATLEPGLVLDLPLVQGQRVRAGDTLARLDRRRLDIEKLQLESQKTVAEALVEVRKAEKQLEENDRNALKALAGKGASNPKQLADAETEYAIAEARLAQAERDLDVIKNRLSLVQTRLDDTEITAPFDGIVLMKHTEQGQWVGEGDAIAEIVSTGTFRAWLDIPQRFAAAVHAPDTKVQITIEATGLAVPPTHPTLVPLVDSTSRTFWAYVDVQDDAGHLAPGMSVVGWVPTGQRAEYTTVPRDALLRNQSGFFVYAVREQGPAGTVAMPVPLEIRFEIHDVVAVRTTALRPGDRVVVEGNERLFPMAPVAVTGDAAAAAPGDAEQLAGGDS